MAVLGKLTVGEDQPVCRGDTFGVELLMLGASVVAVNHKAHAHGGQDLGFAALRVYLAHAFIAASEDLVARRGSQIRLLSVPQAEGLSDTEELRELLLLNCPSVPSTV